MEEEQSKRAPDRKPHPHRWILGALLAGAACGLLLDALAGHSGGFRDGLEWAVREVIHPVGKLFLRLLFMAVAPLVFSSLAIGVYRLGDLRRLGKIGAKTLAATVILSALSVALGLALVNLFEPGKGIPPELRSRLMQESAPAAPEGLPWLERVILVVPDTIRAAQEVFEGHILAVMFLAMVFGAGLAAVRTHGTSLLVRATEGIQDLSLWVIALVLRYVAPIGVAALGFTLTARLGLDVLEALGKYVLLVIAGLAIQEFLVYSIVLKAACGLSPRDFFRRSSLALITAFATSSSNATLPTTLRVSRERLGIPEEIGNFVLTLGSTLNQNGTALFEGITVVFIAQLYGKDLGLEGQLTVFLLAVVAGIGTAGVPSGSIPLIAPVLTAVGVPAQGIGIIIGVDRILDMCRTVLNVTGDLVAAAFIARTEGALRLPPERDAVGPSSGGPSTVS